MLKRYDEKGIVGITDYLAEIRKIQEERRVEVTKQKQDDKTTNDTNDVRPASDVLLHTEKTDGDDAANVGVGEGGDTKGNTIYTSRQNIDKFDEAFKQNQTHE